MPPIKLLDDQPVYQKLADLVQGMIVSQSLRVGDRIPSVRQFSRQQRVSVPTALQAYVTLETRGLIVARPKSGFYVRGRDSELTPEPIKSPISPKVTQVANTDPLESLLADHSNAKIIPLGAALPSCDLLPGLKLTRTMAAIGRRLGPRSVAYDMAPGDVTLRREIARRSLEWGCAMQADDFIVTIGATEAVSLALRTTCRPGDVVIVESPTYFGLASMLREQGLKALPVPVDCTLGIDLQALEKAVKRQRVAACVLIPNFHNPVGFVMPDDRKKALVAMLSERDIPIIEDDIYGDLQHDGPRPRCLRAFGTPDSVILCGSYSKTLAPGYRVGYIAAGKWQSKILAMKQTSTLGGALLPELAIAEFLKNGGYDRYLRSVRQSYHHQVAQMKEAIVQTFPKEICLSRPKGGFLLWCELPKKVDALQLFKQARTAGISIAPGPLFSPTGDFKNFIRINCGYPWSPQVERAIGILGHLIKQSADK